MRRSLEYTCQGFMGPPPPFCVASNVNRIPHITQASITHQLEHFYIDSI